MKYIALSALVAGIDFYLYSISILIDVSITLAGLDFVDLVRSKLSALLNQDMKSFEVLGIRL
jgi:hypothetical protein